MKEEKAQLMDRIASYIWEKFKTKMSVIHKDGGGLNYANNPLCPFKTSYKRGRRDNIPSYVKKYSVIETAYRKMGGKTIFLWTKEKLDNKQTIVAFELLREINGVNRKIASLFCGIYLLYPGLMLIKRIVGCCSPLILGYGL